MIGGSRFKGGGCELRLVDGDDGGGETTKGGSKADDKRTTGKEGQRKVRSQQWSAISLPSSNDLETQNLSVLLFFLQYFYSCFNCSF